MQNLALLYCTIKKIQRFEDRVIWRCYGRFSRTITRDYTMFFSRVELLQEFNYEVVHWSVSSHRNIDALSHSTEANKRDSTVMIAAPIIPEDSTWVPSMQQLQQDNEAIGPIYMYQAICGKTHLSPSQLKGKGRELGELAQQWDQLLCAT